MLQRALGFPEATQSRQRRAPGGAAGRARARRAPPGPRWRSPPPWVPWGLARTDGLLIRPADDLHFDRGYFAELEDRIVLPALASDALGAELHFLFQRPARGLDCAALD